MTRGKIRHVLLDADGVLQTVPGGGQVALAAPYLGDRLDVLDEIFLEERPALRGESDFAVDLRAVLERHGLDVDPGEFYAALWRAIEVSPEVVDLVRGVRGAGYGVHLGTNQHRQRATYMRLELGYDELFDVSCYSWELGSAKPEPAYFDRAAALIGVPAEEVLFVDDNQANVDGARAVGLVAERWDLEAGLPALLELLRGYRVDV